MTVAKFNVQMKLLGKTTWGFMQIVEGTADDAWEVADAFQAALPDREFRVIHSGSDGSAAFGKPEEDAPRGQYL